MLRPKPATCAGAARSEKPPGSDAKPNARRKPSRPKSRPYPNLSPGTGGLWPAHRRISVAKGYEAALGAALGDDLDASTNSASPAHWTRTMLRTTPLCRRASTLRSSSGAGCSRAAADQIGVVARAEGAALRGAAQAWPTAGLEGRRSVALGRFHGGRRSADRRRAALAEKNRLGDLEREAARPAPSPTADRAEAERASGGRAKQRRPRRRVEAGGRAAGARSCPRAPDRGERREADAAAKRSALTRRRHASPQTKPRLASAGRRPSSARRLGHAPALEARLLELRAAVAERRGDASEARAALQTLIREAETAARRRDAIAAEIRLWTSAPSAPAPPSRNTPRASLAFRASADRSPRCRTPSSCAAAP